jgi:hypothetical protein
MKDRDERTKNFAEVEEKLEREGPGLSSLGGKVPGAGGHSYTLPYLDLGA